MVDVEESKRHAQGTGCLINLLYYNSLIKKTRVSLETTDDSTSTASFFGHPSCNGSFSGCLGTGLLQCEQQQLNSLLLGAGTLRTPDNPALFQFPPLINRFTRLLLLSGEGDFIRKTGWRKGWEKDSQCTTVASQA